jgi:hypothetical protein
MERGKSGMANTSTAAFYHVPAHSGTAYRGARNQRDKQFGEFVIHDEGW